MSRLDLNKDRVIGLTVLVFVAGYYLAYKQKVCTLSEALLATLLITGILVATIFFSASRSDLTFFLTINMLGVVHLLLVLTTLPGGMREWIEAGRKSTGIRRLSAFFALILSRGIVFFILAIVLGVLNLITSANEGELRDYFGLLDQHPLAMQMVNISPTLVFLELLFVLLLFSSLTIDRSFHLARDVVQSSNT